jgi:hypothetical protein
MSASWEIAKGRSTQASWVDWRVRLASIVTNVKRLIVGGIRIKQSELITIDKKF